jgi:hypothetical protein
MHRITDREAEREQEEDDIATIEQIEAVREALYQEWLSEDDPLAAYCRRVMPAGTEKKGNKQMIATANLTNEEIETEARRRDRIGAIDDAIELRLAIIDRAPLGTGRDARRRELMAGSRSGRFSRRIIERENFTLYVGDNAPAWLKKLADN